MIWLEDPRKYRYLRKSEARLTSRRFPIKEFEHRKDWFKVVGYEKTGEIKHEDGLEVLFDFYWLKRYDDGCPDGDSVYGKSGRMPDEGVRIEKIILTCKKCGNIVTGADDVNSCFGEVVINYICQKCKNHWSINVKNKDGTFDTINELI
jgi:hypothetical protein